MEKLVSKGLGEGSVVPETYVFPEGERPVAVDECQSIPVIDLEGGSQDEVSKAIMDAGKDFGIFHVTNHGIPKEMMDDVMKTSQEFFEMPAEDKAQYYSDNPKKDPRLFTGQGHGKESSLYWRDCLLMSAYPVETFRHIFPAKPANFWNVISRFSPEVKALAVRLLRLISVGLGLEDDYLAADCIGGPVKMIFSPNRISKQNDQREGKKSRGRKGNRCRSS